MMNDPADASVCCRNIEQLVDEASPFSKLIAFGFYDGPTSGIAQCDACKTSYRIMMVDWDEHQDKRVFAISELPISSFQTIVETLAPFESPRWPVWVPKWRFPSEEIRVEVESITQDVLASAKTPELVMSCSRYGERILRARRLDQADLVDVVDWFSPTDHAGHRDWFSFLGLIR